MFDPEYRAGDHPNKMYNSILTLRTVPLHAKSVFFNNTISRFSITRTVRSQRRQINREEVHDERTKRRKLLESLYEYNVTNICISFTIVEPSGASSSNEMWFFEARLKSYFRYRETPRDRNLNRTHDRESSQNHSTWILATSTTAYNLYPLYTAAGPLHWRKFLRT